MEAKEDVMTCDRVSADSSPGGRGVEAKVVPHA